MPLAPLPRPSGSTVKPKSKAAQVAARKNGKPDDNAQEDDDENDDDETTTDDSSDEETALEMDGQELWTQTYCATCDCLIEPGEGIAKADDGSGEPSPTPHSTLKSRSGTIKARTSSNTSDQPLRPSELDASAKDATNGTDSGNLKRTHSAGRLQARAGAGPLGPHKRTGSAGSRLNALSELRPTTKLNDDKGKAAKSKTAANDTVAAKGRKSPAISRPSSAASSKSQSNSSDPSSFKSNDAAAPNATARSKGRGFLGGLTPAALKQQQAEMASKRNAPLPLYCSERCRLIDERRSSGLGELAQYLSQPLAPPGPPAWAPAPAWPRTTSMPSVPNAFVPGTPESECMCPECLDKYAEGGSAGGATIPSGASDTATESSNGYVYGRIPASQKPRTASGRMVTPLNLHAPDAGVDSYFPSPLPYKQSSTFSPRVRPADTVRESVFPPQSPSATSAGKASASGTDGSGVSSESGSSLWEPRIKHPANRASSPSRRQRSSTTNSIADITSGQTTSTATPALTPRHSMIATPLATSSNTAKAAHRLSVPVFGPTQEDDEDPQQPQHSDQLTSANLSKSVSSSLRTHSALGSGPLSLLLKDRQHHAAPSVDVFSDHVGSPGARGSLLSRSLASEHTLIGASGITLSHQHGHLSATPAIPEHQASRSFGSNEVGGLGSSQGSAKQSGASARSDFAASRSATNDDLSLAVGSLRRAQSRADGIAAPSARRMTDNVDKRTDMRRQSFFGTAGPERRNSNAVSIASSGSGSNTSGWLRSLSSAWLNWRGTASPAPIHSDSENQSGMESSGEWQSHTDQSSRRESTVSRDSGSEAYLQRRDSSVHPASTYSASPAQPGRGSMSLSPRAASRDRSAGITPTQSLVAKPSIRRGSVPAYVREIGQGVIPGDASDHKGHETTNSSLSTKTGLSDPERDEERRRRYLEKKEARHRRSRDIAVLPPLLAPPSRSGSSTNLYAQMPRNARTYSSGRTQMYVGSAGSGHAPSHVPQSPNALRSPYHSSFALAQDASRAAMAPARPNSAAGYHALPYGAGTSPRTKGLGWGAMTSIAAQPLAPIVPTHSSGSTGPHPQGHPGHHHPSHGHHHSISYGHAAALAARQAHHDSLAHGHRHHQHAQHAAGQPLHRPHATGSRNGPTKPALERHSTTPALVTLHRSPTPSVPEDGGEMTSQDLTSGEFISRPNSAMAAPQQAPPQQARHHRSSLMPPPRSRSSQSVRPLSGVQPTTPVVAEDDVEESVTMHAPRPHHPSQAPPHRTWSYDHLGGSGLKTYPILQLPDRETHDVYDPGWGLGAGGLAKHLGATTTPAAREFAPSKDAPVPNDTTTPQPAPNNANSSVQKGFQPHRKKLFYFDA